MTLLVYVLVVAAITAFIVASAVRAVRYARAPLHLRWELYPVPREGGSRAAHGGSYLEQSDWWTRERRDDLAAELRFMIPEMLLLRALRVANRPLWFRSFPFHFGLYLIAASGGLVLAAALARIVGPGSVLGRSEIPPALAAVTGASGLALSLAGAGALLHRRLTDPALRACSTPADIFNLAFFVATLALTGAGYVGRPDGAPGAVGIAVGLCRWDATVRIPPLLAAGLVAGSILVAYIPLTHMSHFIAKFFTYHRVRWDDRPLVDRPRLAAAFARYLAYRTTWSAPHIATGQPVTWHDVAASNPAEGKR